MSTLHLETAAPPATPPASGFSALEWSVIALAGNDSIDDLATPARLSRAAGSVFDVGASSRLADPRLEALRRLAVHAWHRGVRLPVAEIHAFVAAGFAATQAETLVRSITGSRHTEWAA